MQESEIVDIDYIKPMNALEFIISMRPCVPMSQERKSTPASNSEIRRWLDQSAIQINEKKPKWKDPIEFPVTQLVYFPKSKERRTTVY